MIQYTLRCTEDHRFDSWFQSAGAFDKLHAAGMVTCAVCGSGDVEKAMMAPSIAGAPEPARSLSEPAGPVEQMIARLRRHIEATGENMGRDFAAEARAIHEGTAPRRTIYGEASATDARSLIEDGVPVAPLPFTPGRKTN